MGSSSDVCCHDPRALGGLGNRLGAAQAAGRSSGGSAGQSPEITVAGDDAGNYVPGRILPVDPRMPPSPLQLLAKQLTSPSLTSISLLTWLCLLVFYPA